MNHQDSDYPLGSMEGALHASFNESYSTSKSPSPEDLLGTPSGKAQGDISWIKVDDPGWEGVINELERFGVHNHGSGI